MPKKTVILAAGALVGALAMSAGPAPVAAQTGEVARIITAPDAGGGPHVKTFNRTGGMLSEFMAYDEALRTGVRVGAADLANSDGDDEVLTGAGAVAPHFRTFQVSGEPTGGDFHSEFVFDYETGIYVAGGDVAPGVGQEEAVFGPNDGGEHEGEQFESLVVVAAQGAEGVEAFAFVPYDGWMGEVRVAVGNVDGDAAEEVITAPGPGGGPHIKAWNIDWALVDDEGADPASLALEFMAYSPAFGGGVYVAAGDVAGTDRDEIITGAGAGGGPHVRAFNGNAVIAEWMAYDPAFGGGIRVAAGDVDDDANDEVVTGAGRTGGPHVKVWVPGGGAATTTSQFMAYNEAFRGGIFVAVAEDVTTSSSGSNSTSGSS